MEQIAIVVLFRGDEPTDAQNGLIAGSIANILGVTDNIAVSTMNQTDISKILVRERCSTVIDGKNECVPVDLALENALIYVKGLFPNGISSERAAMQCVMGTDTERKCWMNALEIISKYPPKKIHDTFDISLITLKNLRVAYTTCASLAKIGE